MLGHPKPVDPEVAAATFGQHLQDLWNDDRVRGAGWVLNNVDSLHVVVSLPAQRPDGATDIYHVHLGAEFYDAWPPTVAFVSPPDWKHATTNTRWWPIFRQVPPWFQLHPNFNVSGVQRQLVCFSKAAEYYMTGHNPKPSEVWQQGKQTVASTLWRLQEILKQPYYQGPSRVDHP